MIKQNKEQDMNLESRETKTTAACRDTKDQNSTLHNDILHNDNLAQQQPTPKPQNIKTSKPPRAIEGLWFWSRLFHCQQGKI